MKISDLMIPDPITITANASITDALELMKLNSIRHLPVVSRGNILRGFVTLADLKQGLIPSMVADLSLSDLMIRDPIAVEPDDDIEIAALLIYKHKIGGMPVVKKGKVVGESAGKNEKFLKAMLDTDKGSRFVGEIAIGTNYDIKRFSKNILFDEKLGGTCHLAVGASILEAGGKNHSALHWDMICDMKKDARITADGKVVYRNGKFTI